MQSHGIIFAAGLAKAWGGTEEKPYPKSLEWLGRRRVIEHTILGLTNLGINSVSLTLWGDLIKEFLPVLEDIQERLGIQISYIPLQRLHWDQKTYEYSREAQEYLRAGVVSPVGSSRIPELQDDSLTVWTNADQPVVFDLKARDRLLGKIFQDGNREAVDIYAYLYSNSDNILNQYTAGFLGDPQLFDSESMVLTSMLGANLNTRASLYVLNHEYSRRAEWQYWSERLAEKNSGASIEASV